MLTPAQKSLVKRAQRQANLDDEQYRDLWRVITGWEDCDTSTDPRIGDRHVDKMMGMLEAIYWLRVDQAQLTHAPGKHSPFLNREYWSRRNKAGQTTRDQYAEKRLAAECNSIALRLQSAGYPIQKIWGITNKLAGKGPVALKAALSRTLASWTKKMESHGTV